MTDRPLRPEGDLPADASPKGEGEHLPPEIQALLEEWVRGTVSPDIEDEMVEEILRQHEEGIRLDLAAFSQRIRAEVDAEARRRRREAERKERDSREEERGRGREYVRFSLNMRIQHVVLFSSCILLIVTGLPIKFHDAGWAAHAFALMGGIETSSILHRIGAVGLICVGVYHLVYVLACSEGRLNGVKLLPRPRDLIDLWQMLRYFTGRTPERPKFGRFSYVEKFDYWAVYWGMVIMIGSGFLLWFENLTLSTFPKYFIDIAKETHSDEALLATLAIIVWHFYNVHFNPRKFPMNKVWITGKLSEEEMVEEHPLEYEEILRAEQRDSGEGT